jgi:hypothetical protein
MEDVKSLRGNQAREAARLFIWVGTIAGGSLLLLGLVFPRLLVLAAPGLAVYLGIVRKLRGRRAWLDPYGAWIGGIVVNVGWAALFLSDFRLSAFHLFVLPLSLFSVAAAAAGLYREVQAQREH